MGRDMAKPNLTKRGNLGTWELATWEPNKSQDRQAAQMAHRQLIRTYPAPAFFFFFFFFCALLQR